MGNIVGPEEPKRHDLLALSYVLPIAAQLPQGRALSGYLRRLGGMVDDVIVVDGSPQATFEAHARLWSPHVRHLRPETQTTNGKVGGVMTGIRAARHDCVVAADDDVRYRRAELARMLALLQAHEVVRPQNFFRPLPWHARWDTARSLLNRLEGGDWPGTLGLRRSVLLGAGGYSGEVLFENLELVRTIRAAGGREIVPLDLFVLRRPPAAAHFLSQRVRQAYDEWARPSRLAAQMALLPAAVALSRLGVHWLMAAGALAIAAAEMGRRKGNGRSVFPPGSALWVLFWLAERAVTSWLAFALRLFCGGVRYRTTRLKHAATPPKVLQRRVQRHLSRTSRPDAARGAAKPPD